MELRGLWSLVLAAGALAAAAQHDQWHCGQADTGGRTLPRGDVVVQEGRELRLQCELRPDVGEPGQMRFLRGADLVEPEFVRLDGRVLRLHVPRPPASDSTYYCKRLMPNGTFVGVCLNNVIVSVPPREVEDFSCESANWEELRCTWHAPHNYLTTRYNLTFLIPQRASRSLKFFCTNMTSDSVTGLHTCIWNKYTQPHYRRPYNKFLFNLTAVNALGNVSQSIPFDHYAHIRPNPPENFKVIEKTTHGATLIWKIPSPLDELGPGLNRKLIYCSEYDEPDDWTSVNGSLLKHNKTDYSFELTGLKYANVRYDVRLSLKPTVARDDMWSNFSSITFRTLSELPSRPPDLAPGGFEAISSRPDRRIVTLYWKQIEPYEENGDNFTYRIVRADPPIEKLVGDRAASSKGYIALDNFPMKETTLTVVSSNLIGRSRAASSITIPAQERLLPEPGAFTKIAYGEGLYELSWRAVEHEAVDYYTIFWCDNIRDRPYQCEGRLQWERVPSSATAKNVTLKDDKIYQFAISANGENASSGMVWASCTIISNKLVGKMRNVWINRSGATFIEVSWKLECSDRIGTVKGYRISYCPILSLYNKTCTSEPLNATVEALPSIGTSANITGLRPHTTYSITVAMITKFGVGIQSDPLYNLTYEGKPTPPINVSVSHLSDTRMLVTWSPPESMNGWLKEYVVYYFDGYDIKSVKVGRTENHTEVELLNLMSYANHTITVAACTVVCSDLSAPVMVRTAVGKPGEIDSLRSELFNMSQKVNLSWKRPSNPGGLVDYYEISVVKLTTTRNETYLFNSTATEFEIPLPVCQEPDIISYKYAVRVVNVDNAVDHGAAVFSNANFVNISVRTGKYDPVLYRGPWSKPSENKCYPGSGSRTVFILGILVAAIIAAVVMIYFGKRIYVCYQKMKNIKACMPPGLEPHIEKDLKLHSGKWGGDMDKLTKPAPDSEFLLLTKDSSRNSDIKRSANCDTSNCSVNTESTAFSITSSNQISDSAKDSPELMDDAQTDSLSPNSSLRLRNINGGSRPGSVMSAEPWNSPNGLNQPDGMPPYSAVGVWPSPAEFDKTEAASNAANHKGYVSFGSFANDRPFNNARNLPPNNILDRRSKATPLPLVNIYNDHEEPAIPDLPSNYVVANIVPKPAAVPSASKSGYVSVTDPVVIGRKPNPPAVQNDFCGETAYVQLPGAELYFPDKPVISSNCAYIKNSDLRTDNLDGSCVKKNPQNATSLKQNNVLNDNLMSENVSATLDSLSPPYCKIGPDANNPHSFDFQHSNDMHHFMTDYSDTINHDNDNIFLTAPPVQSNPSVSSHYVPHNPNANRL